jgi:hypothetical protein
LAAAIGLWLVGRLRAAQDTAGTLRTERWVLVLLVGSTGLLLLHAQLPSALPQPQLMHEGETLATARLIHDGMFPWRDVFFIHGLLEDMLRTYPGLWLIEHSRWGARAGETLWVGPAFWLGLFALHAYLFRKSWLFLLLTVLWTAGGHFEPMVRFLLLPWVWLLLVALLRRATVVRAGAVVALLLLQSIITPESAYCVVAAAVGVISFEAVRFQRGTSMLRAFRRTLLCSAIGAALALCWALWLAHHDSLDGFVDYYRTFVPHHELTGGMPIRTAGWEGWPPFWVAVILPCACWTLIVWHLSTSVARGRQVNADDWAMATAALFLTLYYQKFLGRADGPHLYHVFVAGLSPMLYVTYRLLRRSDRFAQAWIRRLQASRWRLAHAQPVTALALIATAVLVPRPLHAELSVLSTRFRQRAPEQGCPQLGFLLAGCTLSRRAVALQELLDSHGPVGARLFDFTNSPLLFHYLMDQVPVSRFSHVSMAIRQAAQLELVEALREQQPYWVAYDSGAIWQSWDDIPNPVRHYAVSEYLLTHYRPALRTGSYGLWTPLQGGAPLPDDSPARQDYFRSPCDWGYAPHALATLEDGPNAPGWEVVPLVIEVGEGGLVTFDVSRSLRRRSPLYLEFVGAWGDESWWLSDRPNASPAGRTIRFRTRSNGLRPYRVRVSSCSQWHGYASERLYLRSTAGTVAQSLRLWHLR